VTGGWRKYHYEEFHGLVFTRYCLSDQMKIDEMTRFCSLGERRNVYKTVIGKPDVKGSMECRDVEGGKYYN